MTAPLSDHELAGLMCRWQAGWARARGYDTVADGDSCRAVHIGLPERDVERIALTPSTALYRELAARGGGRGTWLTAPTRDRDGTAALARAAGFDLNPPEWLMTRDLGSHPEPKPPDGYTVLASGRGDVAVVEVMATDGLAAKGHLAVHGQDGVADRVFTVPPYRRQGLASLVMGSLAAEAVRRGARTGILVASDEGRYLYQRLGWQVAVEIAIAVWGRRTG